MRLIDFLVGWWNWLSIPLKRGTCCVRGHRYYQIDQNHWCTRCGDNDAEPPRPTVQVGCAHCPSVLERAHSWFHQQEVDDAEGH